MMVRNAAQVVALALVVSGCGEEADPPCGRPAEAASSVDRNSGRPFAAVVWGWRTLDREQRVEQAVALAHTLKPMSQTNNPPDSMRALAQELVQHEEWYVILGLDERLMGTPGGEERREDLYVPVSGAFLGARRTLEILARRNERSVILAPHRPGGIPFLLQILRRGVDAPPFDRCVAAYLLGVFGDESILGALEDLSLDETRCGTYGTSALSTEVETLGDRVREAMSRIRARASGE